MLFVDVVLHYLEARVLLLGQFSRRGCVLVRSTQGHAGERVPSAAGEREDVAIEVITVLRLPILSPDKWWFADEEDFESLGEKIRAVHRMAGMHGTNLVIGTISVHKRWSLGR